MSLMRGPANLGHLQHQINRMLDQFDPELFGRSEELSGGTFSAPVDVKEDAEDYTVLMEIPGVPQENISITLQENVLTIRGNKEQQNPEGEGQYRRVERSYGGFSRSLTLPRNVDSAGVQARLEDGVLRVTLPKRQEAKPRQINISL